MSDTPSDVIGGGGRGGDEPGGGCRGNTPRDGPATTFETDPLVVPLVEGGGDDGETFGIVLVAGWGGRAGGGAETTATTATTTKTLIPSDRYDNFLSRVRACFADPTDCSSGGGDGGGGGRCYPNVYLYPVEDLHVTVATFRSIQAVSKVEEDELERSRRDDETSSSSTTTTTTTIITKRREELLRCCREIVELARSYEDTWPREPARLVVDKCQIGKRAGIILWKDISGSIRSIRRCIQRACGEYTRRRTTTTTAKTTTTTTTEDGENEDKIMTTGETNEYVGEMIRDHLSVPPIIHTTFLRFYKRPETAGSVVQERFRNLVANDARDILHAPDPRRDDNDTATTTATTETVPIDASTITLVCERVPYMHVPRDDRHVYLSVDLTEGNPRV